MNKFIRKIFHRFGKDQKGSMAVEAVLAVPMLFWAATATFTFYDAFKAQNATFRANYTISDMLSRQTQAIDLNYLNGLHSVFRYMTHTRNEATWIRISVVTCESSCADEPNRVLAWDWSHGANGARDLDDTDLLYYESKIPLMATGNRLILVETSRHYNPPFANFLVSFAERDLASHVVTRPRFAPQLCWETCATNTGGSDGDDGNGNSGS
ncbi:MAG: hypothetical protein V3V25_07685 [Paracoccaceae bacterium]